MAKSLKPRSISADEAVQVASHVAPELPSATRSAAPPPAAPDKAGMLSVRLMESTLTALARTARDQGVTQRQIVARALRAAGVAVAEADLEDRPAPKRRA